MKTRTAFVALLIAAVLSFTTAAHSAEKADTEFAKDPFESVMWGAMQKRFFNDGPVIFDQLVKVMAPDSAEDQFNVPVTVDASALDDVTDIIAVADLNPIPKILEVRPVRALSFVGFRVKLQQSTPIHVGVRTSDGVWHIGGVYVDAAGGGCTAPAMAHGVDNWMETLGVTRAVAGRDPSGDARMTFKMKHPMDTGLAAGIPVFYMSDIQIKDDAGELIADVNLYEPISEDPTLTLKPSVGKQESTLQVSARDTEGNEFGFPLTIPAVEER